MIDSRKRFSETAKVYDKSRPSYPKKLISWIIKSAGLKKGATIADIGCGTGISTRLFLNKGFNVVGIDPNEEMLKVAKKIDGDFYKRGEAVKTGLDSDSIDLIVTAQAMHWFDLKPTIKEFKRILKLNGWCFAFWNVRKKTPVLKDYDLLIRKYSKDYSKITKPFKVIEKIKKSKELGKILEKKFSYSQIVDLEGLEGRAFSSSYIAHGVKDKKRFKMELEELFKKYQKNQKISFDYETIAIGWKFTYFGILAS